MVAQHEEIALTDSDEVALLRRRARRRLIGAIALVVFAVIALPIILDEEPKPVGQDIVIQIPSQSGSKFSPKIPEPPPIEASKAEAKPEAKPEAVANDTKVVPPKAETSSAPDKSAVPKSTVTESTARGDTPTASKPVATSALDAKMLAEAKDPANAKGNTKAAAKTEPRPASDKDNKTVAKAITPAETKADAKVESKVEPKGASTQSSEADAYVVPLGAFLNQANVKSLQAKVTLAGLKSYSEVQTTPKGEQIRVRAGPYPTRDAAEKAREQLKAAGLTVGPVTKL